MPRISFHGMPGHSVSARAQADGRFQLNERHAYRKELFFVVDKRLIIDACGEASDAVDIVEDSF